MTAEDDPGLPIKFGPCSNGEYVPVPLTAVERAAIREGYEACAANARALGMSRREFMFTATAAATTLLVLQGCAGGAKKSEPGGRYAVPSEAGKDIGAARDALSGEEFIFDVQGHHLEYDLMRSKPSERFFGSVFPQVDCGKGDPHACFAREVFMEEFFLHSDTNMVTLSALPIAPKGSPLSAAIMDETRRTAELACGWESVLLHAQVLPNYGALEDNLDGMEENAQRYPIKAWKVFTHFPDAFGDPGNAWRLDDRDPHLPRVGHAFIEKARELGVKTICAHKGFGTGSRYASPEDVPAAARDFPDVDCIFYGSPQDQIETFRSFEISAEFQERYGYPALTRERKAKVLGLNGARVYGIEPTTEKCEFTRGDLEEIRRQIGARHETYGPRNAAEVKKLRDHPQGGRGWGDAGPRPAAALRGRRAAPAGG